MQNKITVDMNYEMSSILGDKFSNKINIELVAMASTYIPEHTNSIIMSRKHPVSLKIKVQQ